jgi:hypothetical protein
MRNGQSLGALLGYQLERHLHEASGKKVIGPGKTLELDWMVFELRRRFPLTVTSGEQAAASAQRLVSDGWAIVQQQLDAPAALAGDIVSDLAQPEKELAQSALQEALDALVSSLDGLADLGLAEAMHQLAGRNLDRAAAATDMIGRAAPPPDRFDVAITPRGGRGIEQRLLIAFGNSQRPAGWATGTPRTTLAPEADAFVAERLGPATGVTVRLVAADGTEIARCLLSDLGLAALDFAADAASTGSDTPFPLLLDRARRATGKADAFGIGLEAQQDADLIDLLAHAEAWHRALGGRPPLGPGTVQSRGDGSLPDSHEDVKGKLQAARTAFEACSPDVLPLWGMHLPENAARGQRAARLRDFDGAADVVAAAKALFGADAIVTGSTGPLPADLVVSLGDQEGLGTAERGRLAGWLQDTARVRPAVAALDGALIHDESLELGQMPLMAAQSPVAPYAEGKLPLAIRDWVGGGFPHGASLGPAPVMSAVIVGEASAGGLAGIELDAWSEIIPQGSGSAAIAANLSAPDSRAPNTMLLAVPGELDAAWTETALFSVVDEALELSTCRAVDLDATRRIPAFLPAVYLSEYEEPTDWRGIVSSLRDFPHRYVAKGTS